MISLFAPETASLISCEHQVLTFTLARPKKASQVLKLRFCLENVGRKHIDVSVRVLHCRAAAANAFLCVGRIHAAPGEAQSLQSLLETAAKRASSLPFGRRSPRVQTSMLVMSRELPGYRAMAVDISQHGMRLHCQRGMSIGSPVQLTFESDLAALPGHFALSARVAWCRPQPGGREHAVGVEFVNVSAAQSAGLEQYCRLAERHQQGDVQQRQIGLGEFTDRSSGTLAPLPSGSMLPPAPPPPRMR